MKTLLAAVLAAVGLTGCSSDSSSNAAGGSTASDGTSSTTIDTGDNMGGTSDGQTDNPNGETTANTGDSSATYRVTFTSTWSMETHPTSFPGNPHFSGLVGAIHNEQVIFWEAGQMASSGIELMAETGSKAEFIPEIDAAIADGRALSLIDGGGIGTSPGTVMEEFSVTSSYAQLTIVSMLAPSPDWFVGVHNLDLRDERGMFIDRLEVNLKLYDSGTDSGLLYTSDNSDTSPQDPIALVDSASTSLPFEAGTPSVGLFVLERIN